MEVLGAKQLATAVGVTLVIAPLALWLSFFYLAKFSSIDLRRALPWLRVLRWVAWILATPFMFAAIVNDSYHHFFVYGCGLFSFSAGLSFSQNWLKKRLNLNSDNA
jgi:general stress protein CsbA